MRPWIAGTGRGIPEKKKPSRIGTNMPSMLFVTRAVPAEIGPGGKHRTYQIQHDLQTVFGADHVHTLSLPDWRERHADADIPFENLKRLVDVIRRRVLAFLENPLSLLHWTGYSSRGFTPEAFVSEYRALLERLSPPIVTVVDDVRFARLVAVSREYGVPVIACTHNLESLDLGAADIHRPWGLRAHLYDLSNEIEFLRQCADRLFISRVETGLIGGLGLSAEYYPYLPVGAIRTRLEEIRGERARSVQDPGLFVLLGSAMHETTRRAFEWFLAQARGHGVPSGLRLVLAGTDTDRLDLSGTSSIEALGWVNEPELGRLLVTAKAVVVPQFEGFGSVTRIVELSCAGVPALIARHPTRAIDLPPGVHVLGDTWAEWCHEMAALAHLSRQTEWDYDAWEETQPRTLHRFRSRWMTEKGHDSDRDEPIDLRDSHRRIFS